LSNGEELASVLTGGDGVGIWNYL